MAPLSKPLLSAFLTFRQSPCSFRVVRLVAFAFHSMFVWIVFVCHFKLSTVSPPPDADSDTSCSQGVVEEEAEKCEPGSSTLRAAVRDVSSRRVLAYKLRSKKQIDESASCWQTFLFVNARQQTLFTQSWTPANGRELKGLVVVLHGLNEHSGRYVSFAKQLNSQGYGVYAMDWIGHGGSDGLHGYVASLDHIVADTESFLHWVTDKNPGVPCFLFGHSTGGAVALKAASLPSVEAMLEGIILTSPALRVRPAHPVVGVIAPVFSFLVPTFQFKGANKRGIPVSRDPVELAAKYSDPLVYTGPIRARTGSEILRISAYLQRNMDRITVPFFVLHGTADRVTDPFASQDLYQRAPSMYKKLKLYDGFLHDLLFEPEKKEITEDILNWMNEKLNVY